MRITLRLFAALGLLWLLLVGSRAQAEPLAVQEGDSVVILGNTFGERMQLFGYFESFLHSRFPSHQLRIRNLAWSADEVNLMERPLGFPDLVEELQTHQADLIFLCFGMNESFAGLERLSEFQEELSNFVDKLQGNKFNHVSSPRIVIVSPIAHEERGEKLPRVAHHNQQLEAYTAGMSAVAEKTNSRFVDLFTPTREWSAQSERELTFNGIHLTEFGDRAVSQMMARALQLLPEAPAPYPNAAGLAERLRRAVYEKNYHFSQWWHAPNASYIHGRRNDKPGALHLKRERQQQQQLIAALDREIWSLAKPDPQEVWAKIPVDGRPVWYPTPGDRVIPGVDEPATWAVLSDGEPDTRIFSTEQQRTMFQLPDGYQVNLYASDLRFPIANPMALQFDAIGRLWVANTPTWPHPLPGQQPQDSLVILTDNDQDGVADKHDVFVDGLNLLHGFALGPDGVYIAQTPNMLLVRDTDNDDVADWFRVVLHGFGAEDAEHSMNNFRWSRGGSLFFTQGIFFHTQVETPAGPRRVRDAAVFSYHPLSQQFDVYASHEFSNPYGNVFGIWGRGILLDASAGDYYPMDVVSANYSFPKKKERTRHLSFGPGGSIGAGCEFLFSEHFPENVQGRFLVNHCEGDVGTHWYTLAVEGTNYRATRHDPPLLTCRDRTFRPVAMTLGPDGALYIADFYSHIFENVNFSKRHPGRDHAHGRIWRVTHRDRLPGRAPAVRTISTPEVLDLLKGAIGHRELARRELQRRGAAQVVPALERWIEQLDATQADFDSALCEAMWVYQSLDKVNIELLARLLEADEAGARVAATQTLRSWQDDIEGSINLIRERIDDPDPRVRLQAVLACGFSKSPAALEIALGAAAHELDPGLRWALDQTVAFLEAR